eukprot:1186969-Prorocentrum_minimum.AAC.1
MLVGLVYAVDAKGFLAPAAELVYNDAPWLENTPLGSGGGGSGGLRLAHPRLAHEVAERVGARSVRRLMLAQAADTLALGVRQRYD